MKKVIYLFLITTLISTNAQNININPNKSAEPWYLDNYKEPIKKIFINDELKFKYSEHLSQTQLPSMIDHSFSKYMRPIFNQDGGSCGSASRICYMFAYEINNYRRKPGNLAENKYPSHFTWLLTGQNSEKQEIAKANGIPNSIDYGGDTFSKLLGGKNISWPDLENAPDYGWMNGYEKWLNAMKNRLETNLFLTLNTPENLEILKGWIFDHNGDSSFAEGGVAGTGIASDGMVKVKIPINSYQGGKYIVKSWGPQVDHGVTWSGFDDNIAYDFNGDGIISNDIDITNDGKVDMADWEKGAMIMLNSWGNSWANSGVIYVPYRLLKINNMSAEFYYVRKQYSPLKIMKISMTYNERSNIKIEAGISEGQNSEIPQKNLIFHHFNFAGNGKVPLLGRWADGIMHEEPLEFAYDITDLDFGFNTSEPYTYFLKLYTSFQSFGSGRVNSVSIIDYTENENGIEYFSELNDVEIKNYGKYTYIPIKMPGNSGAYNLIYIPQNQLQIVDFDSEEIIGEDGKISNIIDGDETSVWHTEWYESSPAHPHYFVIDLGENHSISALEYIPRLNNENGRIKNYEFYLSNDLQDWSNPVTKGEFPNSAEIQRLQFEPQNARYAKLVALSEVNGNNWTSIAEINFLKSVVSSVNNQIDVVNDYILFQNYPNPFNPSTTIKFGLPKDSHVTLEIFSILGEKVATLINQEMELGFHQVEFDGTDLTSGIYVYRIKAGEFVQTRKLVLMK